MTNGKYAEEHIRQLRAALARIMRIAPRPWMPGGVKWREWDEAYETAEALLRNARPSR